jgi:hypothetical protein
VVREGDVATFRGQFERDGAADAAGASRDKRDFSCERFVHLLTLQPVRTVWLKKRGTLSCCAEARQAARRVIN